MSELKWSQLFEVGFLTSIGVTSDEQASWFQAGLLKVVPVPGERVLYCRVKGLVPNDPATYALVSQRAATILALMNVADPLPAWETATGFDLEAIAEYWGTSRQWVSTSTNGQVLESDHMLRERLRRRLRFGDYL